MPRGHVTEYRNTPQTPPGGVGGVFGSLLKFEKYNPPVPPSSAPEFQSFIHLGIASNASHDNVPP